MGSRAGSQGADDVSASRWVNPTRLGATLVALALTVAACGGSDRSLPAEETGSVDAGQPAPGTAVFGAEQEMACADWIASCAGSLWGVWTLGAHTMPRAFDITAQGYSPSPLLAGEPTVEVGPPLRVTYRIAPAAVWSDGTPITAADFAYTWRQIVDGEDIYDKSGYSSIASVDAPDPKTAVVTFAETYAAWRDLFGGFYGVLPAHLLEGKDRAAEMQDGYAWSGGPWMLDGGAQGWEKGESLTLVPNPAYWGAKPSIQKVVFRFIEETSAEFQAYKSGQVMAIYPTPQLDYAAELKKLPNTTWFVEDNTLGLEGVWFNAERAPVDSQAVRQALAYATDREAIVEQLFAPLSPDLEVSQSLLFQVDPTYYEPAFAGYTRDLSKVDALMTGDGWKKSGGVWTKGGTKATVTITTTAGDARRELMQQILQSQWKQAGFEVKIDNTDADTLFGEWGPEGEFVAAIWSQGAVSPDPGLCYLLCSENIPSEENELSGGNWTRLASPELDEHWTVVDGTVDVSVRVPAARAGQRAAADEVVGLPIAPLPDVGIWNTAKLAGPISDNPVYSMFWNMHEWSLVG